MNRHTLRDKQGRFRPAVKRMKKTKVTAKQEKPVSSNNILNVFLLDDTASMLSKLDATINGFNQVLRDTREVSEKTGVPSIEVLAKFGELGHFRVDGSLRELSRNSYYPNRNATALWWAVIETIRLAEQKQRVCPDGTKVVITIFTDGENNTAYDYHAPAKILIDEKQKQGWVISFMGAGTEREIRVVTDSVGIYAANTMAYDNTVGGTRAAFNKLSKSRVKYANQVAAGTSSNLGFFAD